MSAGRSSDPDLDLLTGPGVQDLLAAAFAPAGATVLDWALRDVDHRPGRRTTTSYVARVAWPDAERVETVAASVSAASAATDSPPAAGAEPGRLVVTDGDRQVEVWRFPFDPELPALPAACFAESAAELLRRMGIDAAAPALRVVSYRPRKRAVVQIDTGEEVVYAKVLRPKQAADLHQRHSMLAEADLPIPTCLGWSSDGVLVLSELRGTPLRAALDSRGVQACPPEELVRLLDRLPADVRTLPRRQPWAAHASHYAGVVASALPADADRVRTLATQIDHTLSLYEDADDPTHGDFYEAQLTVADGRVAGMLDIDTVGPGSRADDLACMLAHLSVLAVMDPARSDGVRQAGASWIEAFDRSADRFELRVRAAAVVLSLAPGPFRAQEPGWEQATRHRIDLAERWLTCADTGASPF
ncbi:aminoglycoside phosphotransferase [Phytoactinopolyspora alkaliphila]|uniref:Aminoglycoside phosphotransferase n=1 Tax=Phytoactinopolyspora alkaliphila TaxID=1783498 RepID=A0A6N9YMB0_9ACTN|nr:aminoglycoside phosphotransferase [Phytoactinopolyspora alkaliphila]NED96133.1 aminoglycoside phosphotransferase [Phytoactinopolyspora alkaliphila]